MKCNLGTELRTCRFFNLQLSPLIFFRISALNKFHYQIGTNCLPALCTKQYKPTYAKARRYTNLLGKDAYCIYKDSIGINWLTKFGCLTSAQVNAYLHIYVTGSLLRGTPWFKNTGKYTVFTATFNEIHLIYA